jgi:hypothetical protein
LELNFFIDIHITNLTNCLTNSFLQGQIVCIFCNEKYADVYSAWSHYAAHLEYTPIRCKICNHRFSSHESFAIHGTQHVDIEYLPFARECNEVIERWGLAFLGSLHDNNNLKPEYAAFCLVCEKLFPESFESSSSSLSLSLILDHVHNHLKYHPYECLLCKTQKVYINRLDVDGIEHLRLHHNINCSNEFEAKDYFLKANSIKALDKLLSSNFEKIKLITSANMSLLNLITPEADSCNESVNNCYNVESLFSDIEATLSTLSPNTITTLMNSIPNDEYNSALLSSLSVPSISSNPSFLNGSQC